jgi:hypothetical protein
MAVAAQLPLPLPPLRLQRGGESSLEKFERTLLIGLVELLVQSSEGLAVKELIRRFNRRVLL